MLIREITREDIAVWLALAHEGDEAVARLVPDLAVFYCTFDEYIERKIAQHEAYKATDIISKKCLGIIAFSKNNNRISFIGITEKSSNFTGIGKTLLEFALKQLDSNKVISASVIDSNASMFKKERALYESFGFIDTHDKIMDSGVPAILMKKEPK